MPNFNRSLNFKLIKELCPLEIQATFFFQTLDTSVLCHVQADIGEILESGLRILTGV